MEKPEQKKTDIFSAPPSPCGDTPLALAAHFLRQGLYFGSYDGVPTNQTDFEDLNEILLYLRDFQQHLSNLAKGNLSGPILLDGFTGNILKESRDNLNHIIYKARRLADGDFSSEAGRMGDLSEAFEAMGKSLQAAFVRLEQQKQDMAKLSEKLRREQIRLQKLAFTDPLTGIANRRQFFQAAIRELERIRRTKGKSCLAMLDIDHFKDINDSLGHAAGDKALRHIAKIISSIIRPYDIVGRYGGDEFIFLFPEIARDNAYALLERIRDSVEKENISAGKGNPPLTVSIGLTDLAIEGAITSASLNKAVLLADEALYKAKGKSRNHICIV